MDVVPPLQLVTIDVQKLPGKSTGVTMTISTTVVPQPVQIDVRSPGFPCQELHLYSYDTYCQPDSCHACR